MKNNTGVSIHISPITFNTKTKYGIIVDSVDYSTLVAYSEFNLPVELINRFNFWYSWYIESIQEKEYNMDWFAFQSYGLALAIDLKILFNKNEMKFFKVFFGDLYGSQGEIEIIMDSNDNIQLSGILSNENFNL